MTSVPFFQSLWGRIGKVLLVKCATLSPSKCKPLEFGFPKFERRKNGEKNRRKLLEINFMHKIGLSLGYFSDKLGIARSTHAMLEFYIILSNLIRF